MSHGASGLTLVAVLVTVTACGPSPANAPSTRSAPISANTVALVTPTGDSAMNDTLDSAKVVVENVITSGGQSGVTSVTGFSNCTKNAPLRMTAPGTAELVPLTAGELVRLCGLILLASGDTKVTLVRGTGVNCGTAQAVLLGPLELTTANGRGLVIPFSQVPFLDSEEAGNAICVNSSGAGPVTVFTRYTKYP